MNFSLKIILLFELETIYLMKSIFQLALLIFLARSVTFSLTTECSCTDWTQQSDCSASTCFWTGSACRLKVCSDYAQSDCTLARKCKWSGNACESYNVQCSDYTTETACDTEAPSSFGCAWSQSCKSFTKCSDYKPGATTCVQKSLSTSICVNNADKTACEDGPTSKCSQFTS